MAGRWLSYSGTKQFTSKEQLLTDSGDIMETFAHFTGQKKARACDWAGEVKGETGGLEERGKGREDGTESHGQEKLQVARVS